VFARLLHGAVALSLASEPAAAAEAEPAPETPEAEQPTPSAAPENETPQDDEAQPPASPSDAATPAAEQPTEPTAEPAEEPSAEETPSEEPAAEEAPAEDAAAEESPAEPAAVPPPTATEAPRPIVGPAPTGRGNDIVDKALLGGGIASLTLTAGLIGTTAWAWREHNHAKRTVPNLSGDEKANAEDRRDQMRTIGMITTATAALYGTTGVVLLLLRGRDRKSSRRTAIAPSPTGVSLVGRF